MIFTTINGDQYTILIDFEKLNNHSSFNNYISEYLSKKIQLGELKKN